MSNSLKRSLQTLLLMLYGETSLTTRGIISTSVGLGVGIIAGTCKHTGRLMGISVKVGIIKSGDIFKV